MDMKMDSGMKGMSCAMCGAPCGSCHCGKGVALFGLVLVVLGVLLWRGKLSLELTAAVVLVLLGLKKFFMGLWGNCCH